MSPSSPPLRSLNPFAPEYNPIPPGITPHPHAPPPLILPLPSTAAFHQPPPPPLLFSGQIFSYVPSTSHTTQQTFYTNYTTYYAPPPNQISTNPPPPPPPRPQPPQAEAVIRYGQRGRGCTTQRRGFWGGRGRGRGRGRESSSSGRDEKNESDIDCKFERRSCNEKKYVAFFRDDQFSTGNRHKVTPLKPEEEKTTVMIKNIPYDCPRNELVSLLDHFCLVQNTKARNEGTSRKETEDHSTSAYDFLYLPIDFRTQKSRGFAFVNFTNARAVWKFFDAFHLKKWDFVERNKWPKKIEVVCAKIQGKEALMKHFSESIFECETDDFLPVCFSPPRDGSGQPGQPIVVGNRRASSHWEPRNNHKA